jgi:NADH-quinone oxidoreductase subunit D
LTESQKLDQAPPAITRGVSSAAAKQETLFDVEEMELNFGPQHPSTHGVLRLKLRIDGERIVDCYPIIGYLHRGTEKLFELHPFVQNVPHTDRMDYIAAATSNLAYVGAVEKLFGLVVPPRARYIRVLLSELQRISSHLLWLATHAIDIGAMTPFFYCFRERELVLDLFEEYCGARLTLNCMRPGGQPYDFTVGWTDRCREFAEMFPSKVDEYEGLLTNNRIWKTRTVGVGVLPPEMALDYGLSGPLLRGSGINWDLRKARPYEAYPDLQFDVPVRYNCDTYDRYLCRVEEMRQSARIILQCLDRLPEGPVMAKRPRVMKGPKEGEVYHSIEGPKGEIGFYIVTDGTPNPYRCHVRSPSFINLQSLPDLCRGALLADLVAIIGTTDIVLGEVDR